MTDLRAGWRILTKSGRRARGGSRASELATMMLVLVAVFLWRPYCHWVFIPYTNEYATRHLVLPSMTRHAVNVFNHAGVRFFYLYLLGFCAVDFLVVRLAPRWCLRLRMAFVVLVLLLLLWIHLCLWWPLRG